MFESKDGCNTGKEGNEISHGNAFTYFVILLRMEVKSLIKIKCLQNILK